MQQVQESAVSPLNFKCAWLFGGHYDCLFFYLPFFSLLLLVFCSSSPIVALSAVSSILIQDAFMPLGSFHQGVTWFHYFDKRNRENFFGTLKNIAIFAIAPVLIVAAGILGQFYLGPLFASIYLIWTVQHLTQQNVGILLLYRNAGENEINIPRTLEARTLQIPAIMFAVVVAARTMFHASQSMLGWFLLAAVTVSLICCFLYIRELYSQASRGASINLAAVLFWFASTWFFLPQVFLGQTIIQAMMVPLVVHWCQYIGLNYMLVKRKYSDENRTDLPVNRPIIFYFGTCLLVAAVLTFAEHLRGYSQDPKLYQRLLAGLIYGLTLAHYFQDAFVWKFRNQFQRESILRFLKPNRSRAASAPQSSPV